MTSTLTPLTIPAHDGASFSVCPYGAHITSWMTADGAEQLFLSKDAVFKSGTAIRGGVPVIFPQFHTVGSLPRHGFARTTDWHVLATGIAGNGAAQAILDLSDNPERRAIWPYRFCAQLHIQAVANTLEIALHVSNRGDAAFSFTTALHTYFAVQDIDTTAVVGLQGTRYRDAVTGQTDCVERDDALQIPGEIDRVYAATPSVLQLQQQHQITTITSSGFTDTVIWNPGTEAAAKMADMEANGEQHMLCIEAGAIEQPVVLAPGQRWVGTQAMRVLLA